jgi:adenylate kinase
MKSAPKKPFNLILLGDPASGKGTQAARLVKKYHFYDLDMGREVRTPAALAQYDYAHTTAIGHLTPTAVVRNIFKQVIAGTPARRGILFNGTPKMINEAKLVARELARAQRSDPFVIYLSIPADEMFKRASSRKEYINGKLMKRDDDSRKALMNRKRYYQAQVMHVVKFFKERYHFKRVSGVGTETEVWARINAAISAYHKTH